MERKRFVKRRALRLAGAAGASLAALAALRKLEALPIPSPERFVGPHPEYTADVIVYRDGDEAVAVDSRGREIARDNDISELLAKIQGEYPGGAKIDIGLGKFKAYSRIDISVEKIVVEGHGWGTEIELGNDVDDNLFHITAKYFKITDILLIGNKENNASGHGIYANGTLLIIVFNCYFDGFAGHGVIVENGGVARIIANRIVNNGLNGVHLSVLGDDSFVVLNDIGANSYHGIGLSGVSRVKIIGNNIYQNGQNGIDGYNAYRNYIIGNEIIGNQGHGIRITSTSADYGWGNIIKGNEIEGTQAPSGQHGVSLQGYAHRNVVVGNFIRWSTNAVVETGSADYNMVFGNVYKELTGVPFIRAGAHTYMQDDIPNLADLPTDGYIVKGLPLLVYDPDTATYYIASWNGSSWVKTALS